MANHPMESASFFRSVVAQSDYRMGMNMENPEREWVAARNECTAEKMFPSFRAIVKANVEARCEQYSKGGRRPKMRFIADSGASYVACAVRQERRSSLIADGPAVKFRVWPPVPIICETTSLLSLV